MDASLQELLTESMEELERQMASREAETGGNWAGDGSKEWPGGHHWRCLKMLDVIHRISDGILSDDYLVDVISHLVDVC